MSATHEAALKAIVDAIEGTTPITGVAKQTWGWAPGAGVPADDRGYWTAETLREEPYDDQLGWHRSTWTVKLMGAFGMRDATISEQARISKAANYVCHAISRIVPGENGAGVGSDGTSCLWRCNSIEWDIEDKLAVCLIEVQIELEIAR